MSYGGQVGAKALAMTAAINLRGCICGTFVGLRDGQFVHACHAQIARRAIPPHRGLFWFSGIRLTFL
jgi:hypothetical protein